MAKQQKKKKQNAFRNTHSESTPHKFLLLPAAHSLSLLMEQIILGLKQVVWGVMDLLRKWVSVFVGFSLQHWLSNGFDLFRVYITYQNGKSSPLFFQGHASNIGMKLQ